MAQLANRNFHPAESLPFGQTTCIVLVNHIERVSINQGYGIGSLSISMMREISDLIEECGAVIEKLSIACLNKERKKSFPMT